MTKTFRISSDYSINDTTIQLTSPNPTQTIAPSSSRTHNLWFVRPAPYPLLRRNFLKKGPKMT